MMVNVISALVVIVVIAGAVIYIFKAKKRGTRCIGCPYANSCGKKGNCGEK